MIKGTLIFDNITNNGKPCTNPVIVIQASTGDIAFPCGDKVKDGKIEITIPDEVFGETQCVKGYIKCSECDHCEEVPFEACLCDDSTDCKACQACVNGLCVDLCPDKKCINNTCVDCEKDQDCPPGFICINGECVCGGLINEQGYCVNCIKNDDCGPCKQCQNGDCVDLVCPNNLICIGGGCGCPKGTYFDAITNTCRPNGCSDDSECGECETCVGGQCQPIVCPEGYKCVGGECIYWPCTNTSCGNGADCGPDCGCLDGECVPCYLLECQGRCKDALGCKCNENTLKCEPVKNCGQYCDGETPCLDENCTCYNNKCVSCENFPCDPDDCTDRYNCGCKDGDCGGGFGCSDTLELNKLETCTGDGCGLEAIFTTENKCGCDPIEVRTKNVYTCADTPQGPTGTGENSKGVNSKTILEINNRFLKNGKVYADYLKEASIGDDELLEGTLKTTITLYKKDVNENWVVDSVIAPSVADVSIIDNVADNIVITSDNLIVPSNSSSMRANRKAVIEIRLTDLRIPNNDCIKFGSKVLANYEIDFSKAWCDTIASFTTESINKLVDNESTRRPLFVWYKSNNGTFKNTEYVNNGTYEQSGWFRKEYGVKSGKSWKDKVSSPEKHSENQGRELWPNYNYKVKVDCGCKVNDKTISKLFFCCPKDVVTKFDKCNKYFKLDSFEVCSVNGKLSDRNGVDYTIPTTNQTNYLATIYYENGDTTDIILPYESKNKIASFIYDDQEKDSIVKVVIGQKYFGGVIDETVCLKEIAAPEKSVPASVVYDAKCGQTGDMSLSIFQSTGVDSKIKEVAFFRKLNGSTSFARFALGIYDTNVFTTPTRLDRLILDRDIKPLYGKGDLILRVYFVNGCSKDVIIPLCKPDVKGEALPTPYAKGNCPLGGNNPNIEVSSVGFGEGVEYSIGGSFQTSNVFQNVGAGTYTITARELVGDDYVTATDTLEILEPIVPQVSLTPSNICIGQNSVLSVTAPPNTTFNIAGPNGNTLANITIPTTGVGTLTVNQEGEYKVTLTSTNVAAICSPFVSTAELKVGGQALTPTIEIEAGNYCVGSAIPFRIIDGGVNATYTLSSLGTGIVSQTLQAVTQGYNGIFTPSGTSGIIKITGVTDGCNTTSTPQITVNAVVGADIITSVASCNNDNTHTITVTTNAETTAVTIGGVAATNPSTNTWVRSNITGLTSADIVATNGTCTVTETLTLQSCDCPVGEIFITSQGDTCGPGVSVVEYNGSALPIDNTWNFVFQDLVLGQWTDVSLENPYANGVVQYGVNTSIGTVNTVRLKMVNTTNGCEYFSTSLNVTAVQPPQNVTITPSSTDIKTGQSVSFTTQQGFTSYVWGGEVTGNTFQSNSRVFTTAGTYTVNVTVANGSCSVTQSLTFNVTSNCTSITAAMFPSPQTACSGLRLEIGGVTGTTTYTITSPQIVSSLTGTYTGTAISLDNYKSLIPVGVTATITATVTDSSGCIATVSVQVPSPNNVLSDVDNSPAQLVAANNPDMIGVWRVQAFKCATDLASNPNTATILDIPNANFNSLTYVIYDNGLIPPCITSTRTSTDLETLINNWFTTNGKSGTVAYNTTTNEFTYTCGDGRDEYERLYISFNGRDAACLSDGTGNSDLRLDLPCQCP